jgi:hypothetical protein
VLQIEGVCRVETEVDYTGDAQVRVDTKPGDSPSSPGRKESQADVRIGNDANDRLADSPDEGDDAALGSDPGAATF